MLKTTYTFSYDENKSSIIVVKALDKMQYIYGFLEPVLDELSKTYNIFLLTYENIKNTTFNVIKIQDTEIKKFIESNCYKKVDYSGTKEECNNYNHKIIQNALAKHFPKLKNIDYIIFNTDFFLLGRKYTEAPNPELSNEFFDYVGSDKEYIEKVNNVSNYIADNINQYVNPLAFMQNRQTVFLNLLRVISEKYPHIKSIDTFIIDPSQFHYIFSKFGVPNRNFYFTDDNRGTRNFIKFPIAQLQHCVYDKFKQTNIDNTNRKLFLFAGSLFTKTSRLYVWNTFLKNLRLENSCFYIPLAKGKIYQENPSEKQLQNQIDKINKDNAIMYNEVINHPLYHGHCLPDEMYTILADYKYGFIPRCVSYSDSLNFRPVLYCQNNILPLLDEQYDPDCLMISKEIQNKITVKNNTDIEEKIKYYESHPNERNIIISELKELFEIKKFYNTEYVKNIIHTYWN